MNLGVTYIPSHLPYHIDRDLDELADIGCNEVLFAIQENHVDTLRGAVLHGAAAAKKMGLRPKAMIWGFLNTFGGGRMSTIMLNQPTLWRTDRDGHRKPMVCLNQPQLMSHLEQMVQKCRDAGFESFFIDEPTTQDCFCEECQRAFAGSIGGTLDPATPEQYRDFQKRTTIAYIEAGCQTVKRVDPAIETICCLMPHDRHLWSAAAGIQSLDMLGTDPYWLLKMPKMTLQDAVRDARDIKALCEQHGKQSQVWLNCWSIPKGVEEEIYRGGRQIAEVGCDSLFTWSFRGGLGTNEESDRPEVAWEQLVKLYRELSM